MANTSRAGAHCGGMDRSPIDGSCEIRMASQADIPSLMEMGRAFHAAAYTALGDLDEGAAESFLRTLLRSQHGLVLTNGTGAIGGIFTPIWFQPKKTMLEEVFWWSGAAGGKNLLRAFVRTGRAAGATAVLLSTLDNDRRAAVDRIVRGAGFVPHERKYVSRLT